MQNIFMWRQSMNPKSIKEPILLYLKELKPSLQKEGITELGLFGSFAKDEATIYSDIDVFIRTTKAFWDKYEGGWEAASFLDDFRVKIAKHFKKEVDLCDLSGLKEEKMADFLEGAIYV
ncbi:nucleotidyltransferase family protein [Helicobacter sp. 23-1044]